MNIPFYIVDVFSDSKYAGNQLAVFLDAENIAEDQMQKIAAEINFAESTFITKMNPDEATAQIRIFTPVKEMQFAGHPIIGTSWVLMNKIFKTNPLNCTVTVPIGPIPVYQSEGLVWLQAAQPEFFDIFSKDDFVSFSNLELNDFDSRFHIQEVTTGSAFIMVPVKDKKTLEKIELDKSKAEKWLKDHCKTAHQVLYFFCLEDSELCSRMLCIEKNQLIEDAATGSASSCLQAFLLKYHSPMINIINNQGEFINRPSQIFFEGKLSAEHFDIKIGGKTQLIAKGEWEIE
ncbi:PhzF family phenazine biosynthesis protein [uncultured Flavobacterium sp.]|uniref:PhzF family phenazine biosynthesis protein n=1 Tax=uncultured Flavobacterium sp. TaxID=165435 RepID=UPI0030EFA006|tara:strand:- start:80582 stop:81448 length:867 start_codon:yes stop_codon:yes gene_type:complete